MVVYLFYPFKVKTETENIQKHLTSVASKTDQSHHENKIRMRTIVDEIKGLFLLSMNLNAVFNLQAAFNLHAVFVMNKTVVIN